MTATTTARPRLFGTDGVRGRFGEPPLDRETVTALAGALGDTLLAGAADGAPVRVVIGGDTRDSTPLLAAWVAGGLAAAGVTPLDAGVVPTPGVAWLTRASGAAAGVSISASHNPHPDNGIKLIDGAGFKWEAAAEARLEERLARRLEGRPDPRLEECGCAESAGAAAGARGGTSAVADPSGGGVAAAAPGGGGLEGAAPASAVCAERLDPAPYLAALATSVGGAAARPLAGLRVALDTGHGAAAPYARGLFEELGAAVVATLGDAPDGTNVNRGCGSTAPEPLAAEVVARGADLGLAFDGDADRLIPVDAGGRVRDGDAVLYLWARELLRQGRLDPPRIVATSMSNLGLERALARRGIGVVRCEVGDREVVATMRREGIVLGGEQSGHVVHLGLATTGDGLLTALQLAAIVARAGRPLAELLADFVRYPQVLTNVRVAAKPELGSLPRVAAAARAVEERLGADGRLVLRYSGTEPLARIMIEGPDEETVRGLAGELAAAIEAEIGVGELPEGGCSSPPPPQERGPAGTPSPESAAYRPPHTRP
jgi:phosphoglucosamine mutase